MPGGEHALTGLGVEGPSCRQARIMRWPGSMGHWALVSLAASVVGRTEALVCP